MKAKKETKNDEAPLKSLLIQKLQALYDIESELVKTLPKMATAAKHADLKDGFRNHLAETKEQVKRLEEAFDILGEKPKKLKAEAIRGLAKDGDWVIKNVKGKEALDVNLIAAASYVEHYEMAGYMAALKWAELLGEIEVADLLEATLGEEEMADEKLAELGVAIAKKIA